MKKQFEFSRFIVLAFVVSASYCIDEIRLSTDELQATLFPAAVAQAKMSKKEKEAKLKYRDGIKTRRRKAVGTLCAKRLSRAYELISGEDDTEPDFPGAEDVARAALKSGCKEGFEHSEVNRLLGYVLYSQDRYAESITAYMALVNEPEADDQKRTDTRYTVAQLMFITEDYANAAVQLEKWMEEVAVVDKGGKILLARAYYELDRKDDSLRLVEEVMEETDAEGQVPRESWLNFQWVLYYEKSEYRKAVGVNRVMLTHYPKIKYWKQLSAMYANLEEPMKELIALDLTYVQDGLDEEKQFVALAYQYLGVDVPYKAATILEKAISEEKVEANEKNLVLLGSAYQQAEEYSRASPVFERAASLSEDGDTYSRLARVYLNLNENEKALIAARRALAKGKLKREDLVWMNRGTAEAALHCYSDAVKSFTRAARFEKIKKSANNWKRYVQLEGERRGKLIANGANLARCKKV